MKEVTVVDRFARPLRDLRISVTDRCNFRCTYCMPKEVFGREYVFLPRDQLLTFEEINRVVTVAARLGVEKIRLTGGEPLLRRNLDQLVEQLAGTPGIRDLALTTNGALLAQQAEALARAGLRRVTVSLDSLDDAVFASMNDVGFPVSRVLEGIEAATDAGLNPVKINMVVKRGVNDHEVLPMAERFRGSGHVLRFIEYMDVGTTNGWRLNDVVPAGEIVERINERWPIVPANPNYPGEVAARYRYADGAGEIGLIASVSMPFCGACTRLRLSADGTLYTCLFAAAGHDLRAILRSGGDDEILNEALARIWSEPARPLLRATCKRHSSEWPTRRDVTHRGLASIRARCSAAATARPIPSATAREREDGGDGEEDRQRTGDAGCPAECRNERTRCAGREQDRQAARKASNSESTDQSASPPAVPVATPLARCRRPVWIEHPRDHVERGLPFGVVAGEHDAGRLADLLAINIQEATAASLHLDEPVERFTLEGRVEQDLE